MEKNNKADLKNKAIRTSKNEYNFNHVITQIKE